MTSASPYYQEAVAAIDAVGGVLADCPVSFDTDADTLCATHDIETDDARSAITQALTLPKPTPWASEANEGDLTDVFVRSYYPSEGVFRAALFNQSDTQYLMLVYIPWAD